MPGLGCVDSGLMSQYAFARYTLRIRHVLADCLGEKAMKCSKECEGWNYDNDYL